jgi:subtilisin family serine protease
MLVFLLIPAFSVGNVEQEENIFLEKNTKMTNNSYKPTKVNPVDDLNDIDLSNNVKSNVGPLPPNLGEGRVINILDLMVEEDQNNPEIYFNHFRSQIKQEETEFVYLEDNKVRVIINGQIESVGLLEELELNYNFEYIKTHENLGFMVGLLPVEFYNFFDKSSNIVNIFDAIDFIEPDYIVNTLYTPNDTHFEDQYSLINMEVNKAWNTTFGNRSILVAVIDTGIDYNHPDLVDNYLPIGWDHVNSNDDPLDDNGHGTHVSGTIAASINNGIGIAGVANVSIFAEKILSATGSGYSSDAAAGINHAVSAGANILSNSWGSTSDSSVVRTAIQNAIASNVTVIAAAGNSGTTTKHYPAAYEDVIAVGSTDQNNELSSFSTYGSWVDVVAPGSEIISTQMGGGYHYLSGTSMATPHVAGVAALLLSIYPDYNPKEVELTLENHAIDLGSPGKDLFYANGLVNATATLTGLEDNNVKAIFLGNNYLAKDISNNITYGVENVGLMDQIDVNVTISIDGSIYNSNIINVSSYESKLFSIEFTPLEQKNYIIKVDVQPVTGENSLNDNIIEISLESISPKYIPNQSAFQGYISTLLNPYLIGFKYENMIDASYMNVSLTLSLLLGFGFTLTNNTLNIYDGTLKSSTGEEIEHPFLISDDNYNVGDKVDIFSYGDQKGTVIANDLFRNYHGYNIPAYQIEYDGISFYYHKDTGFLDGFEGGSFFDLKLTNNFPNNMDIIALFTEMEIISAPTDEDGVLIGMVVNAGTTNAHADIKIEDNGIVIYESEKVLEPMEIYPVYDIINDKPIYFDMVEGIQNVTLSVANLNGEIVTKDNIITKIFSGKLHDYHRYDGTYFWEDMNNSLTITDLLEIEYVIDIPFDFTFYDLKTSSIMISPEGVISFSRENPFIFSYFGGYPSSNLFENYALAAFLPDSNEDIFENILYKEYNDRIAIEFNNNNNNKTNVQVILHNDGVIHLNYETLTHINASIGVNHGGGIYGEMIHTSTSPVGNNTLIYQYEFDDAELNVEFLTMDTPFGLELEHELMIKVVNLGNTMATNVKYRFYEDDNVTITGTIPEIEARDSVEIIHNYTPETLGYRNITFAVDILPNELDHSNNIVSEYFEVVPADQVLGYIVLTITHYSNATVIEGINVDLVYNGEIVGSGITNSLGQFNFTGLNIGEYTLISKATGFYNESFLTDITHYGHEVNIFMTLQYITDHNISMISNIPSEYTSVSNITLDLTNKIDLDYIAVFVDGQFRISTFSVVFDLPLLVNGTHTVTTMIHWKYNHTQNATFQIENNQIKSIFQLNEGDIFNYKLSTNLFGDYNNGWYNFTVKNKINLYTYNITVDVLVISESEGVKTNYTGYLIISTLNGYVIDSNTNSIYTQYFLISFLDDNKISKGFRFSSFNWNQRMVVNSSLTMDNYAITQTLDIYNNYYNNENDFLIHIQNYFNNSGLLYEYHFQYFWYGYNITSNLKLLESNILPKPEIPIITGKTNLELMFGDINQLSWDINAKDEILYNLYQNGQLIANGDEVNIIYDISHLSIGNYNFTLEVFDSSGNKVTFETNVFIKDAIPDVFIEWLESDIEIGEKILFNWTATDNNPNQFTILINGNVVKTGNWESGDLIQFDIANLNVGIYNFTSIFSDIAGNEAIFTFIINIVDTIKPIIQSSIDELTYTEGETGNSINFTISDSTSMTYSYKINNNEIDHGNLDPGFSSLVYSLDGLIPGVYVILFEVVDEGGNIANVKITVTVNSIDEKEPSEEDKTETTPISSETNTDDSTEDGSNFLNIISLGVLLILLDCVKLLRREILK